MATPPPAFQRVYYHGRLMDQKTKCFLEAMEKRLGFELTVLQGCYSGGVSASAGTHDGGGVIDLAPALHFQKVRAAADLGAFVWWRPYLPGEWPEHIHLGIRNHGKLSASAKRQQLDWDHRPPIDGLAGHNRYMTGYHPGRKINFNYERAWHRLHD